jgi:septal ring factor EnvC (AmiA/AmiB activator)
VPMLIVVASFSGLWGQTKSRLEKERMEIIERIDYTSKLLEQKNQEKIASAEDLRLIQEQIQNRKKIIENIQRSIVVSAELLNKQKTIQDSLLLKHQSKKHNYNKLIRLSYIRMLTENRLVFLLSSKNWGESMYRMRSTRTIEDYLQKQMKLMSTRNKKIVSAVKEIKKEQKDLQKLLDQEVINIESLEQDEAQQDIILANLESDQEKLRKDLDRQRKARETLNKEIEKTILATLTNSKSVLEEDSKAATGARSDISNLKFSKQRKLLPWPLEKGVVVSGFGRQKHPSLKDVIISNNGIDISSSPGSVVKSVFGGNVVRVMQLASNNLMVIISHGGYFTVYSRLSEVQVTQGQTVEAGKAIGILPGVGDAVLHFQIWKDKTKLDPEDWLRKQHR